jgi:hypothetical protein
MDSDLGFATSDPHLLDLCRVEGISGIVLTASDGTGVDPVKLTVSGPDRRSYVRPSGGTR